MQEIATFLQDQEAEVAMELQRQWVEMQHIVQKQPAI
tara:strand:+ start:897 stop:1007 length:111 start_codon:yes stop_codon:yes gene_type:complete